MEIDVSAIEKRCLGVRREIIEMAYSTGKTGAHLGGSLSLVEILVSLYSNYASYNVLDLNDELRDRVILSKGHAALALYPVLASVGIIERETLKSFKKNGSKLGGHPSLNGLPGIEFSSGSLGQGLSYGIGVGLALKKKGNNHSKVFVILGDGECDEGSVWESAMSASHFHLDNLIAIVDVNGLQYDGDTAEIMNKEPFREKWESFGWIVSVIDGHNVSEIMRTLDRAKVSDRPFIILAQTVKGKGISFMENNPRYHNAFLSAEQYSEALKELEWYSD